MLAATALPCHYSGRLPTRVPKITPGSRPEPGPQHQGYHWLDRALRALVLVPLKPALLEGISWPFKQLCVGGSGPWTRGVPVAVEGSGSITSWDPESGMGPSHSRSQDSQS